MAQMTENNTPHAPYNEGTHPDMNMKVELYVNDRAEAFVFHDKPFAKPLAWLEYDLDEDKMDFVMDDGDLRNFGIPVDPKLKKYLQNSFQVLMVQMDEETGEPIEGDYFPIVIHRA
ncbi:MAG: hypothetical protein H6869_09010 [Rhodospirillales bacterium]|nr:hypothetical protein [Rhodospirillales bacterium]